MESGAVVSGASLLGGQWAILDEHVEDLWDLIEVIEKRVDIGPAHRRTEANELVIELRRILADSARLRDEIAALPPPSKATV